MKMEIHKLGKIENIVIKEYLNKDGEVCKNFRIFFDTGKSIFSTDQKWSLLAKNKSTWIDPWGRTLQFT